MMDPTVFGDKVCTIFLNMKVLDGFGLISGGRFCMRKSGDTGWVVVRHV